jgi:hypothetical protein
VALSFYRNIPSAQQSYQPHVISHGWRCTFSQESWGQNAGTNIGVTQTGDYSWIMASSALVFMMVPGIALFYSGLRSQSTALSLIWLSMMTTAIVTVQVRDTFLGDIERATRDINHNAHSGSCSDIPSCSPIILEVNLSAVG